jgi:hypothetical protein
VAATINGVSRGHRHRHAVNIASYAEIILSFTKWKNRNPMESTNIYVSRYEKILTELAEVITDAALQGDSYALAFLAQSIEALMEKAVQIVEDERQRGGHA